MAPCLLQGLPCLHGLRQGISVPDFEQSKNDCGWSLDIPSLPCMRDSAIRLSADMQMHAQQTQSIKHLNAFCHCRLGLLLHPCAL